MKCIILFLTIVYVFQILVSHIDLYMLTSPSGAHWKIRAKAMCNSTLQYFCLYNNVKQIFVEGCNGPDWDRKGSKRIFSGSFTRGNCSHVRYQPFNFQTNESMTDCVYAKSICNDEGQIMYQNNSTKKDTTCRCDYANNYEFIIAPRHFCFCIPTEEDCSCYIRPFPVNYTLSTDYECIRSDNKKNQQCIDRNIQYGTVKEKTLVKMNHTKSKIKGRSETVAAVIVCLCLILLIGLLFYKSKSEKMHKSVVAFQRRNTDLLKRDDVNFLRLIHLLFRVACPVIRMKFNHEIKPKQLRKTLDDNKFRMETLYRKQPEIINDDQWRLLYNPIKGKIVKSEEFDIRLTIYLLCSLAQIKLVNVYPDPSDKSDSAMLSRIKYIRNKATRRFEADISEDLFKIYWNDLVQAVNALVSKLDIRNDQKSTKLIDHLKVKGLLIGEDCNSHQRDHTSFDITTEENNFLIVFYILAKIVYPVIKKEFDIKCIDWKSEEIGINTYQEQNSVDAHSITVQDTYLTKGQQQHLSPTNEVSKNFDLRWMIVILKMKAVEKGDTVYTDRLKVINDIQREIVQSSTGMLNKERLLEILESTKKAVLHLGGKWNDEKILRLLHIQNVLNEQKIISI